MIQNKIRVGFDISQLAHGGGVGVYTEKLAQGLQNSFKIDPVFFYSSLRKPYKGELKGVKKFKLPPSMFELLFNKLRNVSIERFIGSIDLYHSSDWVQPPTKAKKVTTVHDLVPILHPEWSQSKIIAVHKRRIKIVEQEIDRVIAVSESTKRDLISISSIPENKIEVIYEGVDKRFSAQSKEKIDQFKKKYQLPDEFILAMGGVGERRNLKGIKIASQGFHLIVAGEDITRLSDEEMPLLYSSAKLLLYPSFYEGFGLPILEAQACGVPVITSNISSMPEVAGNGALLVNPNKLEQLKQAVKNVFYDQDLRKQLIKQGRLNAQLFSWDKCIDQTIELYQTLI